MTSLDSAIIEEYGRFDIPADQIVVDPEIASDFRRAVNGHLSDKLRVDQTTLNRRILSLRKRGEDGGGLPRLRRRYNGRDPKKPR